MPTLGTLFVRMAPASAAALEEEVSASGAKAGDAAGAQTAKSYEGRMRNSRGQFTKAGEDAGAAAGSGTSRGYEGRMRDERGRFTAAGAGAGAAAGKGVSSSFTKYAAINSKKLEKGFKDFGHSLSKYVTLPIVAIGAVSAKMASDFSASMTKIQTQAGGSAKDVKTLSAQVLSLAKTAQQGPQELADSLFHLKSVGLDNVDAMKALKTASDLAAVGGAGLEDTTNALAGAWRTGISGAKNFGAAAKTLNAIIGAGNVRMSDLVGALGTGILASAKTFGLSLKQVGAALATLTDEGVPATAAATRLRQSFSLLGAPSAAADKQLKSIGLSGLKLAEAMRGKQGIIGALDLLKAHLKDSGLSLAEQSQLLSRAFGGGRSGGTILSLINNLDVLKKKQNQVNSSLGKYNKAVATQRKTPEAQFKLLESSLQRMAILIGNQVLPGLIKLGNKVGNIAEWFNKLNPSVRSTIGQLALLAAAFGPVLLFASKGVALYRLIRGVVIATQIWTGAQVELDAAMDANPIGAVILAITALAAIAYVVYKNWSPISKFFVFLWDKGLKAPALAVAHWFAGPFVNFFVSAGHAIAAPFTWLWHHILVPFGHGVNTALYPARVAFNLIKVLWLAEAKAMGIAAKWLWRNIFAKVWHGIEALTRAWWSGTKKIFSTVIGFIRGPLTAPFRWFWHSVVEKVWGGIKNTIMANYTAIRDHIFTPLRNLISKTVPGAFKTGASAIGKFWGEIKNLTKAPVNFVIGTVYDNGIRAFVGKIAKWVGQKNPLPFVSKLSGGGRVPGLAAGGFSGRLPGYSLSDNLRGFVRGGGPIGLAGGEFVVNPKATKRFLPILQRLNGEVPNGTPVFGQHAGFSVGGLISSAVGAVTGFAKDVYSFASDPAGYVKKAISQLGSKVTDKFGSNPFAKELAAMPEQFVKGIISKLTGAVASVTSGPGGGGAAGSGQLYSWVETALALTHTNPNWWGGPGKDGLYTLIMRESGGNPRAINRWDINAKHGDPSRGLMQTIGATFEHYRLKSLPNDIYNPVANVAAGVRYIKARYGDISRVQQANPHLPPRGYRGGGLTIPARLFDAGGELVPGINVLFNGTGRNERLKPVRGNGSDLGPASITQNFNYSNPVNQRKLAREAARRTVAALSTKATGR